MVVTTEHQVKIILHINFEVPMTFLIKSNLTKNYESVFYKFWVFFQQTVGNGENGVNKITLKRPLT